MANPENLKGHEFKPGQSGNPGGLSSEIRAQIDANTRMAVAMRQRMLEAEIAKMNANPDYSPEVTGENLSLVKSTEDRGLGAPKQTLEADVGFTTLTRRIIEK